MHTAFIHRCLELAEQGRGAVSPNPLVGCVIVQAGSVLTEGYHKSFGGAHAERMALINAGELAKGATLYVNLEPCCTAGKQPPCTDTIVSAGIRRVVFGARDPSNAGATAVVLPAPGGATRTTLGASASAVNRSGRTAEIGRAHV